MKWRGIYRCYDVTFLLSKEIYTVDDTVSWQSSSYMTDAVSLFVSLYCVIKDFDKLLLHLEQNQSPSGTFSSLTHFYTRL